MSDISRVSCFAVLCMTSCVLADPIVELKGTLAAQQGDAATKVPDASWVREKLTRDQANLAVKLLVEHFRGSRRPALEAEWQAKAIKAADQILKFEYRTFGDKPSRGRALWISMHGGGSTTAKINDGQWRNQIRLYEPSEGIYLAPRAPTDSWNMWHQSHMDALLDRLIEAAIICADVDPNRVYLMGYSAGGDGVYQLAPRMADRFAAAAMMAGHPNDAKPDGLRNLPFTIHMGANDSAFNRNEVAKQWGEMLDNLHKTDQGGYFHLTKLHEGKGHWMDRQDVEAVHWMSTYDRLVAPERVVWVQSSTTHSRFYWIGVEQPTAGSRLDVRLSGNTITVDPSTTLTQFTLLLNDICIDLDQPIRITGPGLTGTTLRATRSIEAIWASLNERFDPAYVPTARIPITIQRVPANVPASK